jgi:2-polyprenyl-6-methoxyphenol hydroxylase-like FAD-dependent oxidoreductase
LTKARKNKKIPIHEYFDNAGWQSKRILAGMDTATDFYMSRIAQIKLSKWANGRCVVIGDAAFATMVLGTSLAMASAYVLAGEISKIKTKTERMDALSKYKQILRPLMERRLRRFASY